MKIVWLIGSIIIGVSFGYGQGMYLANENGLSASIAYGRFNSDTKLELSGSYSLKGYIDLSYARSFIFDKENSENVQNEIFTRIYLFKKSRLFFSSAVGFVYLEATTDLWKNFPFTFLRRGLAFQGGLHVVLKNQKSKKLISSIFYQHSNPVVEYRTPQKSILKTSRVRLVIFEGAAIYMVGQMSFILGPRINLDIDRGSIFYGFKFSGMVRH
ncbi:MAG: hypothetical protein GXO78_02680 [Calditrichaeota bacterium]|nr:hypothetical protein [Calditrichota bacterium]